MPRRGVRSRTDDPFADALPLLLAERGLTLRQLARDAGVSQSHLSRILRGAEAKRASGTLAARIAEVLDLPLDYFPEYRREAVIEAIDKDWQLRDRFYERVRRAR